MTLHLLTSLNLLTFVEQNSLNWEAASDLFRKPPHQLETIFYDILGYPLDPKNSYSPKNSSNKKRQNQSSRSKIKLPTQSISNESNLFFIQCFVCGNIFRCKAQLRRHQIQNHKNTSFKVVCCFCQRRILKKNSRRHEMRCGRAHNSMIKSSQV